MDSTFDETLEDNSIQAEKDRFRTQKIDKDLANSFSQVQIKNHPDSEIVGEEVTVQGQVIGLGGQEDCEQNIIIMVNYDKADGVDKDNAMQSATQALRNLKFDESDLDFFFNQAEIKMKSNGVQKNFTKLEVLTTILPQKVMNSIKPILRKQEDAFTDKDAYYQAKTAIKRIFGPAANSRFERAMGRVLSDKPSQLCIDLISDLCDHELAGCCCSNFIFGLWMRSLPSSVKQAVSHYEFKKETLDTVLQLADKVYLSTRPSAAAQVSAVSSGGGAKKEEMSWPSQEELEEMAPEVAAAYKIIKASGRGRNFSQRGGRGRGRGGRGFRGGGRGGGGANNGGGGGNYSASNPRHSTPRHSYLPPFSSCKKHWDFGKTARWCMKPLTCPWRNFITPENNK